MPAEHPAYRALPADGYEVSWESGGHVEHLALRWENEGWTATGRVAAHRIEYTLRLTAQWRTSQFLLFRDLDEADLWLGTDGHGRWGEVNGAHRPDLDGATDLALACTPFTHTIPIRRLPLAVGHGADLSVLQVDVETLGVVSARVTYERLTDHRWRHVLDSVDTEFDVDEFGIPLDVANRFRRVR